MKTFSIKQEKLNSISSLYENPAGGWDPNKGFLLIGSVGIGKTSTCRKFFSENDKETSPGNFNKMYYRNAFDLTREYVNNASVNDYWLFIDDLGTEPQFRNHYGTQESPVLETLLRRANKIEDLLKLFNENDEPIKGSYINAIKNIRCFATSNLSLDQLREFYGVRLHSRLSVLFNIVIVSGDKDYRML